MGQIMEAVFCLFYLIFTGSMGFRILQKNAGRKDIRLFGLMTLLLVFGDAFHLVPRILAVLNPAGNYAVPLGIGKLITSVTMTAFYTILYFIYEIRYGKKSTALRIAVGLLALVRIILCFMPQNDWVGEAPVIWGVYRNIPFTILGLVMVVLFFLKREEQSYKWMWLAITLSFAFYIPVVLWADVSPIIGMLMMPKTCMYMWIVVMGYQEAKSPKNI